MLRSYIACFNKEALLIDEVDDKILLPAFMNGLQKRVSFYFPCTRIAQKPCRMCFTGLLNNKRRRCIVGSQREA